VTFKRSYPYIQELVQMAATTRQTLRSRSAENDIDTAIAIAANFADSRKDRLAIRLHEASDATYDFGQSLDGLPHVRGYIEEAANALSGLGDYVAEADIADLLDEVQSFARRRPAIAFGTALLAGVAASQLLQADRRTPQRRRRGASRTAKRGRSRT
jgi:hypothetical protein